MTQVIVFCRWIFFTIWCAVGILMYVCQDAMDLQTYKIVAWVTWFTLIMALLRIAFVGL